MICSRRLFPVVIALALALVLSACAGLVGPRSYTLSEAEIARRIAQRFPYDQRVFELLDVRVDAPRVRLLPQRNRVSTELDIQASERLFGRSLRGALALDAALRYDEQDQTVKLADVRVERLDIEGLAQPLAARLAPLLAEQLLKDLVVHRFKPEDLQTAGRLGLKPGRVAVTERGLEITLDAAR